MISTIICTCNRSQSLERTLESLRAIAIPQNFTWELIVADNNSTDNTRLIMERFIQDTVLPIRYVFEPRQGKSFALNTAVRMARGETLVFTDDDVLVDSDWLSEIEAAFDQWRCVAIGGKIIPVWSCPKPKWLLMKGPRKLNAAIVSYDLGDEPCVIGMKTLPFGANLALKKSLFEKYGDFRTDLGPNAGTLMVGEETEFCRRLLRGGEILMYAPQAIVYHPVDPKRTEKRYFRRWYFDFGRGLVREVGVPEKAVRYFGVPRYLIPSFAREVLRWLVAIGSQRRFYYKLQICQLAGEIYEAWCTSKRRK
jgi:glucosyl-dolichyl phosphate glucuronosyltransferase